MVVSSFAIGILANSVFYLGAADAMLTVLFFNLLGIMPVCFFSTFGPRFGLRQMVLSRFWFGWYGVKLIAIFNVLACIGWSSVNSIQSFGRCERWTWSVYLLYLRLRTKSVPGFSLDTWGHLEEVAKFEAQSRDSARIPFSP